MPALELGQETGKLVAWKKHEGERVSKGEPLLEIETDKAVLEVESPGDGILSGIKLQEGESVSVGQTIAWILRDGESVPPEEAPITDHVAAGAAVPGKTGATALADRTGSAAAPISPKARRLAKERGVDISTLRGSGPGGEILAADIVAAAESTSGPASSIARLMAERTTQSWTTVPHFFVTREVEAAPLLRARESLAPAVEEAHGVSLTLTDLIVAVVARVLLKHPLINASWRDGAVRLNPDTNVGVAMAVSEGVVVPVIPGADKMRIGEIGWQIRQLSERARTGRLRPSDLSGGTFTVSNLGMYEVDAFCAIIVPPQACILAVGTVSDRVVPVNRQPAIRSMMTLTLSCDHRVVDGAKSAAFLKDLRSALVEPLRLL